MRLRSHVVVAIDPSGPLAWESPYAAGVALKKKKGTTITTQQYKIKVTLQL